mmetsp:Transcript_10866/g.30002  ORF Transcript_10866/g.30002 Transcript_10866/m.30002 type:complete len:92 (+) Transcript_10866:425-700(+)
MHLNRSELQGTLRKHCRHLQQSTKNAAVPTDHHVKLNPVRALQRRRRRNPTPLIESMKRHPIQSARQRHLTIANRAPMKLAHDGPGMVSIH